MQHVAGSWGVMGVEVVMTVCPSVDWELTGQRR
jgi:hypothetical protein